MKNNLKHLYLLLSLCTITLDAMQNENSNGKNYGICILGEDECSNLFEVESLHSSDEDNGNDETQLIQPKKSVWPPRRTQNPDQEPGVRALDLNTQNLGDFELVCMEMEVINPDGSRTVKRCTPAEFQAERNKLRAATNRLSNPSLCQKLANLFCCRKNSPQKLF